MNPDDPNTPQGGGGFTPADDGGQTTPEPAEPVSEPVAGGSEQPTPADAPAASCHCGKPSSGGTCTGCNLPEASCSCQPAA
ncbi:MAG: hypothetical protein CEO21_223 [Microgenomates group bacterium Gr01-1014_80]|nr:MAG: hypothetical protein CEO21_223 [Microgenomates group bacterium Gr01-1014_80]